MSQKDGLVRHETLIVTSKSRTGHFASGTDFAGHRTEFWDCPGKTETKAIPTPVITKLACNNNSSNR